MLLAIRMSGDVVGEFAAADLQPRSATVIACGRVDACLLRRAEYLECLRRNPRIAAAIERALVSKLRAANARRTDVAGADTRTRITRVLHELALRYGERDGNRAVIRSLTQPELATLVGAAEPTAHKALRELRMRGIVQTSYRQITILDLRRLGEIAGT